MKNILFYSVFLVTFISCNKKNNIAQSKDYEVFLNSTFHTNQLKQTNEEIGFWNNKLVADTGSYVNMMQIGLNLLSRFKTSGEVNDLHTADSLFERSGSKINNKESSIYFALSQNAITQHKFNEAEAYLQKAEKVGAEVYTINLVKFDINMELGRYNEAQYCLNNISKKNKNLDYIIRKSKFEDHLGHSKESIEYMEQAYDIVKNINKKSLSNWVVTNLADMYSHEGRLDDAYKMYLRSLQLDSANLYALKGIAMICYSNDQNSYEAKRIINFILSNTDTPDLYLTLAEISEWEGDVNGKQKYIDTFLSKINTPLYGNMYNKYLIEIYLNDKLDITKGLSIAEHEMTNRATPETYSWLAFANYKNNNIAKANELINNYVLNKTFEPEALYIASVILSNSNKPLAQKLRKQCKESQFELGPLKLTKLKQEFKEGI
jgi:lipopolysaccharide biosynthesis regulator YciM